MCSYHGYIEDTCCKCVGKCYRIYISVGSPIVMAGYSKTIFKLGGVNFECLGRHQSINHHLGVELCCFHYFLMWATINLYLKEIIHFIPFNCPLG